VRDEVLIQPDQRVTSTAHLILVRGISATACVTGCAGCTYGQDAYRMVEGRTLTTSDRLQEYDITQPLKPLKPFKAER
jgi:hypothetical protein